MRPGLATAQEITTWRGTAEGGLTAAGWWYALVSLPMFRFLLWRWLWRVFIWAALLWQTSKIQLRLLPTHPDQAGGLGTLGVAHVRSVAADLRDVGDPGGDVRRGDQVRGGAPAAVPPCRSRPPSSG